MTEALEIQTDDERMNYPANLFGYAYSLVVEPNIFTWADKLSNDYTGGYWKFYKLPGNHPGFYMVPDTDKTYHVQAPNMADVDLTAEEFGIVCCLYTYSHLSFGRAVPGRECANQFHILREYMLDNEQLNRQAILKAID